MCECQGNPLARVTLALGLPYLLVNRALASLSATGIRRDMFLEFVLFASRPDTLSESDPPPPFLRLISGLKIMYLC